MIDRVKHIQAGGCDEYSNGYEIEHFNLLLTKRIHEEKEENIQSSGYVIHTLEASIWSFLKGSTFGEAVLFAINLGGDTDTIGAVTGGLSGSYCGFDAIPKHWKDALIRFSDILELCERFCKKLLR